MTEEQNFRFDSKIDSVRQELETKIDSVRQELETKIDGLPDALIKRLDDRYVTKSQWWNVIAAVGLLSIGGMVEKLWTLIVSAAQTH